MVLKEKLFLRSTLISSVNFMVMGSLTLFFQRGGILRYLTSKVMYIVDYEQHF